MIRFLLGSMLIAACGATNLVVDGERPYSGFHGSNLKSTEIPLRNQQAVDLFNKHIVR
jgi:hypothetical protein